MTEQKDASDSVVSMLVKSREDMAAEKGKWAQMENIVSTGTSLLLVRVRISARWLVMTSRQRYKTKQIIISQVFGTRCSKTCQNTSHLLAGSL